MSQPYAIQTPLTDDSIRTLRAGDEVLLSGTVYAARDQAHKRLCALIEAGQPLPFDLAGQVIYYVGPTPARTYHRRPPARDGLAYGRIYPSATGCG